MTTAEAAQGKSEAPGAALENGKAQTTDSVDGSARADRMPQEELLPTAIGEQEPPAGSANETDDVSRATVPGDGQLDSDVVPPNGELRRTLHLSLAQENADGPAMRPGGEQPVSLPRPGGQRAKLSASAQGGQSFPSAVQPQKARDGTASIDWALRERVDEDIAAFLTAFDAALAQDSLESRAGLREATDRLLRAGARTRIELERLEARLPLPPREDRAHHAPAWRPR